VSRRGLTRDWSIDLDDSFRGRVVDDVLQFVSVGPPVRTIWLAVWEPPIEQSPENILTDILHDVHPAPVSRFRERDGETGDLRYGSWYPEAHGERMQWGLLAYTIRRGTYVQVAFISDDSRDLSWALGMWRSLRYHPES
jgi:hypothetical protein